MQDTEKTIQSQGNHNGYLTLVSWITGMGALAFGYNTAVVNGALDFMAKPGQLDLSTWAQGVVSSGLTLGAAFGAVFGGPLSDKIGRKKLLIWLGVIFTILGLGCGLAPNTTVIIGCRFILGLAVGAASGTVPVYLAEIAPASKRGQMVSMNQFLIVFGQFLVFGVNAVLGNLFGDHAAIWRVMISLASVPGIVLWIGMYAMPESPRWLSAQNRFADALKVLYRIRSKAQAEAEIKEVEANTKREKAAQANAVSLKDFKQKWIIQVCITGAMLGVIQQFAGINAIMYYGSQVLKDAGFAANAALIANVANGIFSCIGAVIGMYTIDKLGRKRLELTGLIFCAVALITVGLIKTYAGMSSWTAYAIMIIILVYIVIFQGTIGPVTWLLDSEIFPNRYRGLGTGIAIFVLWFANFIVGLLFPVLLDVLGLATVFYVFAVCCVLGACFVYIRVPETKGVNLEDIESYFRARYDKNYQGESKI
ncbi:sugar porter family MFS transporter [Loigolactobacillus bifermentans]|uniref:Major myo-inositol transporter iolt n=1 Tax=Loigolactobacillus bifermentans DSM 20003 TaxID=1423726 RepID=A0A0R1GKU0_9LACO|nr:sugar porter family MFS transporter [Loigolactobacillus bifermentans]KRK33075.1 major myo-inositol transporter iolt [Loigolactobacillus bifermentans DSM 20003]